MATRLARKLAYYPIYNPPTSDLGTGVEFNEGYVLPPTQTGHIATTGWTLLGTAPVWESAVGPAGGGGSWKFTLGPTSGNCRIRTTNSVWLQKTSSTHWSMGMWIKFNILPPSGSAVLFHNVPPLNTGGFSMGLVGQAGGTAYFTIDTTTTQNLITSVTVTTGTWYFLSIIKTANNNAKAYINGTSVGVIPGTYSNTTATTWNWGGLAQSYEFSFNVSNYYFSDDDVITEEVMQEIYRVGSSSRVIKHYTGSAWEESYDQKVWNGTNWIQWSSIPAKYWNGSAWVNI